MIDHQKFFDFISKIHNLFSLQEQGRELVTFAIKSIGCKHGCLLFLDVDGEDFTTLFCEPRSAGNPLHSLRLSKQSPIVEYLRRKQKSLARESLASLPKVRSLSEQEAEEIKLDKIELFMPLISREQLIGILVLGGGNSDKYSPENVSLLEYVTNQVAVGMEKEYLREQISNCARELAVINLSSAIVTSSLDIQGVFGNFVEEIRKVVDVSWAAVVLIRDNGLCFLALSSEIGSAWKVGERVPIKGTATEWVIAHRKTIVECDLLQESMFVTNDILRQKGIRSIVCLPLVAKDKAIGSISVSSRHPNAYSKRHIMFLERLASQLALPIENAHLYAEVVEKARIDGLTGLLNRQALDEVLASEINRHSRYGSVFSLIILDLDDLKTVNDNYGHLAGDNLIREMGSLIIDMTRNADQAFRYGGDEFAILLPNTSIDSANQVAERIQEQVASKVTTNNISCTASLGLASWPVNGIGANEIIAAADAALYSAKRKGGNQSEWAMNL
ncbi:diguanylate cyclase [Chloroflexota bacterium]